MRVLKLWISAFLVFPCTFLGLGGILAIFAEPGPHGVTYDRADLILRLLGFLIGTGTTWLWLNAFFRFKKTPVFDGLIAALVPVCIVAELWILNWQKTFNNSGEDGLFFVLAVGVIWLLYIPFGIGLAVIVSERFYSKKLNVKKPDE
jgi:hypothetical protein